MAAHFPLVIAPCCGGAFRQPIHELEVNHGLDKWTSCRAPIHCSWPASIAMGQKLTGLPFGFRQNL